MHSDGFSTGGRHSIFITTGIRIRIIPKLLLVNPWDILYNVIYNVFTQKTKGASHGFII